ncbi:4Fe-4S binding protein [Thermosulfidibacter takaii]|uniref:4Fe-4S binding protein n=1 Tax=Thermosulfidibacter takaii TaxID=412593 RepID=UPI0011875A87|nr:4Fe-4S binding protein [Thermosulfidibacter takaii]
MKRVRYSRLRFVSLTVAFLIIAVNPFLNYYFHINFIQGWYQSLGIGKLWFVSPLEGLETILVSKTIYLPLLIGMVIPVLLALFLGRVFCSWICPISFLSELVDRVYGLLRGKRRTYDKLTIPKRTLWFALVGEILLSMTIAAPIFVFLSPPGLVGREIMMLVFFKRFPVEGVVVFAVLGLHLVTRRFFCRYLCPLGALLAFLGSKRKLVISRNESMCVNCRLCDRVCPMDLKPSEYGKASVYCWNCGECVDVCNKKALTFKWED